jgi:hypothetical protein
VSPPSSLLLFPILFWQAHRCTCAMEPRPSSWTPLHFSSYLAFSPTPSLRLYHVRPTHQHAHWLNCIPLKAKQKQELSSSTLVSL